MSPLVEQTNTLDRQTRILDSAMSGSADARVGTRLTASVLASRARSASGSALKARALGRSAAFSAELRYRVDPIVTTARILLLWDDLHQ